MEHKVFARNMRSTRIRVHRTLSKRHAHSRCTFLGVVCNSGVENRLMRERYDESYFILLALAVHIPYRSAVEIQDD